MENIYLDYNASAPIHPFLAEYFRDVVAKIGNAASPHKFGRELGHEVSLLRRDIATEIQTKAENIVFTSGGTEAIHLAINIAIKNGAKPLSHIIIGGTEHPAVAKNAMEYANEIGIKLIRLSCNKDGFVDIESLYKDFPKSLIERDDFSSLICLMSVNNETGVKTNISSVCKYFKGCQYKLLVDSCQGFCKMPLNMKSHDFTIDFLVASGHKIGAGFGCGLLAIGDEVSFDPENVSVFKGGRHEHCLRAGTINSTAIIAFGKLFNHYKEQKFALSKDALKVINDISHFLESNYNATIWCKHADKLGHVVSLSLPFIDRLSCLMQLDLSGIAVSAGSACSSSKPENSPVLSAMCNDEKLIKNTIRISAGHSTKICEAEFFKEKFEDLFSIHRG